MIVNILLGLLGLLVIAGLVVLLIKVGPIFAKVVVFLITLAAVAYTIASFLGYITPEETTSSSEFIRLASLFIK